METQTRIAMIACVADNIISSLGFTSAENFAAVKAGGSGVRRCEGMMELPEPFMASLIDRRELAERFAALPAREGVYTPLEMAAILSASDAIARAGIDPADGRVLFVLSSTKGNVHLLDDPQAAVFGPERVKLWRSAQVVARYFGNTNEPVTVSNACISGASALIAAKQEIEAGRYDYAVVVGADMLSRFIVSGFQSFKALSEESCRPFDAARTGLNLGEAAATIVLGRIGAAAESDIVFEKGFVRNDANHISGPSRTGEGAYLALVRTLQGIDPVEIAFVSAHGTATPYNDEMESIALTRAGLAEVPVNSLKGYFGHTLGAAGVLESIVSIHALREGIALKTQGYAELGVTHPLRITTENIPAKGRYCIKMLSGFAGCNAALLFSKGGSVR